MTEQQVHEIAVSNTPGLLQSQIYPAVFPDRTGIRGFKNGKGTAYGSGNVCADQ